MVGILTETEIDDLLRSQQIGRLGCNAEGQTYVVPISYVFDEGRLIGQTTLGKKIKMMRKNSGVCVQVDEIKDLTNWRSVIVWGHYEELKGTQASAAMGLLIDKFGAVFSEMDTTARMGRDITPPRLNHLPSKAIVYCIHITEKTGRFERPDA